MIIKLMFPFILSLYFHCVFAGGFSCLSSAEALDRDAEMNSDFYDPEDQDEEMTEPKEDGTSDSVNYTLPPFSEYRYKTLTTVATIYNEGMAGSAQEIGAAISVQAGPATRYLKLAERAGLITKPHKKFYFPAGLAHDQVATLVKAKKSKESILNDLSMTKKHFNQCISKCYAEKKLKRADVKYLKKPLAPVGKIGETKERVRKFLEANKNNPSAKSFRKLTEKFNLSDDRVPGRSITHQPFVNHARELHDQGRLSEEAWQYFINSDFQRR